MFTKLRLQGDFPKNPSFICKDIPLAFNYLIRILKVADGLENSKNIHHPIR